MLWAEGTACVKAGFKEARYVGDCGFGRRGAGWEMGVKKLVRTTARRALGHVKTLNFDPRGHGRF